MDAHMHCMHTCTYMHMNQDRTYMTSRLMLCTCFTTACVSGVEQEDHCDGSLMQDKLHVSMIAIRAIPSMTLLLAIIIHNPVDKDISYHYTKATAFSMKRFPQRGLRDCSPRHFANTNAPQSVFVIFNTGIRHACSSLIIIISSS